MIPVHGYAADSAKEPLKPFSFERRELDDNDVLIAIQYCGICHSDIHQVRDEWGGALFPMVPGHEIVGIVERVGKNVNHFKAGDHVGVGCIVDSCRRCNSCHEGLEQYCAEGMTPTYNGMERDGSRLTQGGYSTKIVVNKDYVLRIPDNLPLDASAPLLCAGITLYSPLRHWKAGPGKKVAILGLGGLGHMGVKLAHAMGADVTVLSHSSKKQEDSKRLGADHFYATSDSATFSKLVNTFDLIICTVSAGIDWNDYLKLLRRDGVMVVVGVPDENVPVGAFSLVGGRRSLAGSLIGGIAETQEMLDFCGKHNITSDIELIPMQQVNEAYERVLKSDVRYRFVIDIASIR
ncbi:NAD(P)-dependent alcohol dehydrogenase [Legionella cardiaca]|uniref:NAD(P)-dependent alcohol dehydrogenase n=1 Tax=Legionella cardiaca TaxID=1071983 RepID=A0ABY8ARI1_9GAMM|nr:NAD(P)-dependent alcohol dehydrogenase [Legionella cardiaca]WED43294.1 NAD(P)-dependent alcohol dehydrogenase [Legionella cardiaca]